MAARVNQKKEINGVLYLAVAVLLAISYFLPTARTGWLGRIFLTGGRGLLGAAAFALPVVFLYMAIDYLLEKRLQITRLRFTYVLILLVTAAALMQVITVDTEHIRLLSTGDDGRPLAITALHQLWLTGIEPELLSAEALILPGGLLGGSLALAMEAIAGSTGSLILLSALVLSMLVLLFNVSVSRAVGQTAYALRKTHRKVDQVVRSGVSNMKQNRRETSADPKSYDLKLEHEEKDSESDNEAADTDQEEELQYGQKKTGWREQLKRLWSPQARGEADTSLPEVGQEDLSVPGFLDEQQESNEEREDMPEFTGGIEQKSAYDLKLKNQDWPLSLADETQAPDIPVIGQERQPPLPAGVHRVGLNQDEAKAPEATQSADKTSENKQQEDSAEAAVNDRSQWLDRSEDPGTAGQADSEKPRSVKSGQQLNIPYQPPSLNLLTREQNNGTQANSLEINRLGRKLENTLKSFGIDAHVIRHSTGPTITRFELAPGPGVKVSRIVSLADDIALNLAAMGVRIEAPIPGKAAIGIEIPNHETTPVLLRGLLESAEYRQARQEPLTVALGRDIQGRPILCDLTRMPHLLIAGATGSGKSVSINAILMSILFKSSPEDVKMMMIDPKVVELNVYNGIPHLITPVVTDPKKAANALIWAVSEMTRRYGLFADKSVRDIKAYQAAAAQGSDEFVHLPLILLVIDELSDLMATTPTEVEDAIARLTAMARAAGIHLIIATQRPSVDVITGVIKANIPSRIAFAVASQVDSRTILDTGGAEKLLGKGDMLYYPQSASKPQRGQGAFISDPEVERVLNFIKGQHQADYDQIVTDEIMTTAANGQRERNQADQDELLPQALEIVVEAGYASVSLLQRRMNVGYPRAARLIDTLNEQGYVGPFEGSKPRKVLISKAQLLELQARGREDH